MNISKYISINSSLFVIGLYSNITIAISVLSIYHAMNIIRNNFKCGVLYCILVELLDNPHPDPIIKRLD